MLFLCLQSQPLLYSPLLMKPVSGIVLIVDSRAFFLLMGKYPPIVLSNTELY